MSSVSAGFLGSTLTDSLLRDGHEVVGVDCFTANYDVALKRENLKSALAQGRFRFVEADLRQVRLEPLLDGVTHVAHLAALPGVGPTPRCPRRSRPPSER